MLELLQIVRLASRACITGKGALDCTHIRNLQEMPEIKRWNEGSKEIIAEMLTGAAGDWTA